jgi:IclR family pca regulon transcriptional regulator
VRVTDRQVRRLLAEALDERVVHAVGHQVASRGHADLALVEEGPPRGEVHGLVDIGVVEDQHGRVAAELEVGPLEVLAGELADAAAHRGGAGERDHRDVRVRHQRLAHVGAAGEHLQHACGQPGLLEDPRDVDPAGHCRARVGLEHHGVPERQCRGDRADAQDERDVERSDHADDTDRQAARHRQSRLLAGQQVAVRHAGQRRRRVALFGGHVQGEAGHPRDGADLPHVPLGELLGMLLPEVAGATEHGGPLRVRGRRPLPLGLGRARGGPGDVVGRSHAMAPDLVTRGRLDHRSVAAPTGHPLAVDVDLSCCRIQIENHCAAPPHVCALRTHVSCANICRGFVLRQPSAGSGSSPRVSLVSESEQARPAAAAPVQSLVRGLAVIRVFDADNAHLTLSDVARRAELTRATARRVLHTLADLGYVSTDGRQFSLRPKILELGHAFLSSMRLPTIVQPHLESLTDAAHESSSVAVLDGRDVVYLARVPRQRIMTVAINVGTRFPAYATSLGRVLLAHLPPDQLDDYLDRHEREAFTSHTITDRKKLVTELRRVRDQGWALVDQELEEGLRSIAAPIRDRTGEVVAALNLSASSRRGDPEEVVEHLLPLLLETAAAIDDDLRVIEVWR